MPQDTHRAAILALGTAVPANFVEQGPLSDWMVEAMNAPPALERWVRRLYTGSGIETRYSCLPDADYPPHESRYRPSRPLAEVPTTIERMEVYERVSTEIGTQAGQQALHDYCITFDEDIDTATNSITHLIVVSCTGFFAPGLDLMIARRLGLRPTVERTLIGFMGCAAAFNALRMANHVVQGNPQARALIVCVELCSLHIQPGEERENLISASLFSDGAAACVVGVPPHDQGDRFDLTGFHTIVHPDTEADMVWRIGNHGFTLRLSPKVPEHLAHVAPQALRSLVGDEHALRFWAIHPGGRAIVDRLAEIFALTPEDVAPSREVLRRYGNMSSPTILFVLREHRERLRASDTLPSREGVAMAFGPGLVIEMAHLVYAAAPMNPAELAAKGEPVEHLA